MNYGVPYMGSKNRIAKKIIDFLPKGEILVDLFGGGGAIANCAALSNKWKSVIYNELNTLVYSGFKDAVEGKFDDEKRWISRDDFFKLKDTDFYAACCFSFGNSFKSYMYNETTEKYKKAYHYVVMLDDWSFIDKLFPETYTEKWKREMNNIKDSKDRRIKLVHLIADYVKKENDEVAKTTFIYGENPRVLLQSMYNLERLQSIDRLNLTFNNLDYRKVEIPEGSVVYCDIPYKGTTEYTIESFNYDEFYKWCEDHKNKYKIYVSSYEMPEDKFEEVWSIDKTCTMSSITAKKTTEKIFIPK